MRTTWLPIALAALLALLALSGFRPYDRATWALEVAPIVIALPILWTTYDRFPLTTLLYACIFVHAVVLLLGQGADEFLGTQGDPWDTQSDMFAALVGAVTALLLMSRVHDRQIRALECYRALSPGPAR